MNVNTLARDMRVETPLGPVSVVLDTRDGQSGYTGTIFKVDDVRLRP
jgi:hypothetical protein